MARTIVDRIRDKTVGVKCHTCGQRKSLKRFHGCAKCGNPCCDDCVTAPGGRICPVCAGS